MLLVTSASMQKGFSKRLHENWVWFRLIDRNLSNLSTIKVHMYEKHMHHQWSTIHNTHIHTHKTTKMLFHSEKFISEDFIFVSKNIYYAVNKTAMMQYDDWVNDEVIFRMYNISSIRRLGLSTLHSMTLGN